MERFLKEALNIIGMGTVACCTLDTSKIHSSGLDEPVFELSGSELSDPGRNLVLQVFQQ